MQQGVLFFVFSRTSELVEGRERGARKSSSFKGCCSSSGDLGNLRKCVKMFTCQKKDKISRTTWACLRLRNDEANNQRIDCEERNPGPCQWRHLGASREQGSSTWRASSFALAHPLAHLSQSGLPTSPTTLGRRREKGSLLFHFGLFFFVLLCFLLFSFD